MKAQQQPALAPGFLATLAAAGKHENLGVQIEIENTRLRVTITIGGHEPLELVGHATALDAQLPATIEAYAQWAKTNLPANAATELSAEAKASRKRGRRAAPKKKLRKAAAKRKPAQARAPKRAPRPAPKRKAAPQASGGERAGKAECIADYRAIKAKEGDKLTRRKFITLAKTGRRYEKLWANSWPAFVKEASGGKTPPAAKPAPNAAAPAKPAAKKAAAKPDRPKAPKSGPWIVKLGDGKGKTVGATVLEKKVGDSAFFSGVEYDVVAIDAEKREFYVKPAGKKADAAPPAPAAKPLAEASKPKPRAPYAIKTEDGKTHGATMDVYKVGDKRGPRNDWEVIAVDDEKREYTVRSVDLAAAAALLPANQTAPQPEIVK